VAAGAEQSWFTGTDALQRGRRGRLAEASHFVPTAIWFLLIAGGLVVIGYVFLFADVRERRLSQGMMIIAVTTAVAASLLMVAYLNQPYGNHEGSIGPTAMRDVLKTMERERGGRLLPTSSSCDADGRPL
jgi:vacuolar-type H+-ATPase subunit I/STV1